MAIQIEMPKLSDTMTEGTVVRWLKKVGDQVEIGDEIAEIETDKATMAMEAFDEGELSEILIEEGGKVQVGAALAVLKEEGDEDGGGQPDGESSSGASEQKEAAEAPSNKEPAPDAKESEDKESFVPAMEAKPKDQGAAQTGSGEGAQPEKESQPQSRASSGERIKASPLARKMAEAEGLDLGNLKGTGPGGRIVKKDIESALASSGAPDAAAAPSGQAASTQSAPQSAGTAQAPKPVQPTVSEGDQRIELSTMRRIIAERLLLSKTTIPHFYLHVEADAAPLMDIRKQINEQAAASHGNKYTVNDFILKAVIAALQAVPAVNASFNGDHIVQFSRIGVAVAVAVDDGLVTPVVKDAVSKSLLQISREVKDLAVRARDGKLLPNEFDGGTITVSNLGAYGVESFDAIINPPQAAILSVGAIAEKPVVSDGEVVSGLRMNLGLSCDHRVVDGAIGAEFLAQIKKLIEKPALMLV